MMVPDTQPFDGRLDHEDNLFDQLFQVRDKADVDVHLVSPYFLERLSLTLAALYDDSVVSVHGLEWLDRLT